jgi:hypothetical protein
LWFSKIEITICGHATDYSDGLLASRLSKLAEEADVVLKQKETGDRFRAYFAENNDADRVHLLRIAEEMRWAAGRLKEVLAHTRLVKSRLSSPNPQVRFALYIAGWFEASTGRVQYELLETLITAAFLAAGSETPKWASRLAIEMHSQRRWRRSHYKAVLLEQRRQNIKKS